MRTRTTLLVTLVAGLLSAQEHSWQAELPAVPLAGQYAVELSPEFLGHSRSDLGDIRLLDQDGKEIPYVILVGSAPSAGPRFIPYTLLRNEALPFRTVVEVERPQDDEVDALHIRVRPAEVAKHVRVTGSDNLSDWYMVKDEHLVSQGARDDPPHQVLLVDVPRSDYRYFRITMNDLLTPPMQVLDVGRYVEAKELPEHRIQTNSLNWLQEDSARTTRLHIWSVHPMALDALHFKIADQIPYRRSGMVVLWTNEPIGHTSRRRHKRIERIHSSFVLSSERPLSIDIPPLRADTFMMVLDNGDDRPLKFTDLQGSVRAHVLVAHLDPKGNYRLITGKSDQRPPRYDLVHFIDELPAPRDTIGHSAPKALPSITQGPPPFAPEEWWVWVVIIPLIGGMAYMAVRMLRQEGRSS